MWLDKKWSLTTEQCDKYRIPAILIEFKYKSALTYFPSGVFGHWIDFLMESLILAQNERWRRGLGMQVER